MLLSASFVAFLSIISIGSTEEGEAFDYNSLKEVGSIEPVGCFITNVHIIGDYIYVFCMSQKNKVGHYHQYDKQKPFDLLSLILTFDIKGQDLVFGSQYSEVSNCFYIHNFRSKVWKIGIDDHTVTTFLSVNDTIRSLAIASNGQLYILVSSENFCLQIYAPDATHVGSIEHPNVNGIYSIIHVDSENILIAYARFDDLEQESWIGFCSIDKLNDGIEKVDFIWKGETQRLNRKLLLATISQEENSESSWRYPKRAWLKVTENNEGVSSYFDPYSNMTKNASKDDIWFEKTEIFHYPSSSYFDIDRNMLFVCKGRLETRKMCRDKMIHGFDDCFNFHTGEQLQLEMILMYKCLNQTSWCQKTLEKLKGLEYEECLMYVTQHKSKGNLFIKPPLPGSYFHPKTLMIYNVN